mmetsp:Transcript_7996/g.18379  ORF Transcript_7996/g.18379 Transcript_7996/m.18379 type:complete len:409 (-) Transcript_7996:1466-2692(-)
MRLAHLLLERPQLLLCLLILFDEVLLDLLLEAVAVGLVPEIEKRAPLRILDPRKHSAFEEKLPERDCVRSLAAEVRQPRPVLGLEVKLIRGRRPPVAPPEPEQDVVAVLHLLERVMKLLWFRRFREIPRLPEKVDGRESHAPLEAQVEQLGVSVPSEVAALFLKLLESCVEVHAHVPVRFPNRLRTHLSRVIRLVIGVREPPEVGGLRPQLLLLLVRHRPRGPLRLPEDAFSLKAEALLVLDRVFPRLLFPEFAVGGGSLGFGKPHLGRFGRLTVRLRLRSDALRTRDAQWLQALGDPPLIPRFSQLLAQSPPLHARARFPRLVGALFLILPSVSDAWCPCGGRGLRGRARGDAHRGRGDDSLAERRGLVLSHVFEKPGERDGRAGRRRGACPVVVLVVRHNRELDNH